MSRGCLKGKDSFSCQRRRNPCQRRAIIIENGVNENSILKNRLTRGWHGRGSLVKEKSLTRWFSELGILAYSAPNRSRTCTPLDIRTWNVRVYQFRHRGLEFVPRTRVELACRNRHHPLKVACLPISPPGLKIGCKDTTFFNAVTTLRKILSFFSSHYLISYFWSV